MARKSILGISLEKISKIERRRRIIFILKVSVYLVLLFLLFRYADNINQVSLYGKIIGAALFYITGHLVVALSRLIIVNLYLRKHKMKQALKDNFILGLNRVATVINSLILIIAVLSLFNVSLPQLFTGISIVAAAIAILSKDYISNMINGLIIMFSDQLSLNDYIKIGENKGTIVDITLLNIHMVNDDEDLVYIPNNMVFNTDVVNYTKQKIKKTTIEFEISASQSKSLFELEEYLAESLKSYSGYLKKDSLVLKIYKINKDNIQLKYQFVFQKEDREIEKQMRKVVPRKVIEFYSIKELKLNELKN